MEGYEHERKEIEEMQSTATWVFSVNPRDSAKSPEIPDLSFSEFLGFTAETLNRNAAQINHRN
jgi:hypothetical protein